MHLKLFTFSFFLTILTTLIILGTISGNKINNIYGQEFNPYYQGEQENYFPDNGYEYADDRYYEDQYIKQGKERVPGQIINYFNYPHDFNKNKIPLLECKEGPMIGAIVTDELLCQAPNAGNVCPEGTELAGVHVTDLEFCGALLTGQTLTINKNTSCDSDKVGEEVCSNIPDAELIALGNHPEPNFFLESQTPLDVNLREGPYSLMEKDFITGFERCSDIALQFDAGRNLPQFGPEVFMCSALGDECNGVAIDSQNSLSCNIENLVYPRVQDLAAATGTLDTGSASILLGNGDGTFGPPNDFPVLGSPAFVAVGYFNADVNLDLAVANGATNQISILLGNGDGTFGTATNFPVATAGPTSIAVGLFNEDSHLDMAVTVRQQFVSIFLGNGDGTFVPSDNFFVGNGPDSIAVGFFNADNNLDLVTGNIGGKISIFLGNGDGTFVQANEFPAGVDSSAVVVGFFDADTNLDVATANALEDKVSILIGNGDGTFNAPVKSTVGIEPRGITAGFFNADTILDLATANAGANSVSILLGHGDGTFEPKVDVTAGNRPFSVQVGSFNADSNLDLVIGNVNGNEISVLLGNGDGTFGPANDFVAGNHPISVAVGNFS